MNSDLKKDPEEIKRILKHRAAELAVEEAAVSDAEEIEVLEFMLDRERYGIESRFIREVYPLKTFTKVPCTPAYVTGVVNVRGQILSIVDIGRFFDLQRKGLTDLNKVIILHSPFLEFGILADEILGVSKCKIGNIETSLPTLTDVRSDYLKGVTEERLIILDGEKILSDIKLIVNDEVR
jgi:purine-binding chemotaxis protein CheW